MRRSVRTASTASPIPSLSRGGSDATLPAPGAQISVRKRLLAAAPLTARLATGEPPSESAAGCGTGRNRRINPTTTVLLPGSTCLSVARLPPGGTAPACPPACFDHVDGPGVPTPGNLSSHRLGVSAPPCENGHLEVQGGRPGGGGGGGGARGYFLQSAHRVEGRACRRGSCCVPCKWEWKRNPSYGGRVVVYAHGAASLLERGVLR